ncbi:hypothetical protein SEA_DARDANUS_5 [Gordonia phage Dardanus]|uniref:Uncharacterized protein n=1 Tax=Gordonia phage Dardanus TaxID=2588489 RepID=A0A514CWZ7_9CAUD|nr:hypothetical protein KDJ58_gp05 [Gordonia phage Dardanus]QDH85042.1 hypothetical protein SEA_DARDANUS_5 [Gordonia phage Dardanus]
MKSIPALVLTSGRLGSNVIGMNMDKLAARHAHRFDNLPSLAGRDKNVHFPLYVNGEQVGKLSASRTSPKRWTVYVDDAHEAADVWFLHVDVATLSNPDNPFEVVAGAMNAYMECLRDHKLAK